MATPTKIAIGWKNKVLDAATTFTESTEDAAHPVENLAVSHPAKFYRVDDVSDVQSVAIDFNEQAIWDLVAHLYTTASPHRNLLEKGFQLAAPPWASTNTALTGPSGTPMATTEIPSYTVTANGGGSVTHIHRQTYTKLSGGDEWTLAASLYFDITSSDHFELRVGVDGANFFFVKVNGTTGAVDSSGDNGSWAKVSATTEQISGNIYRVSLTGTTSSEGDFQYTVFVLDAAFTRTYTHADESIDIGGALLEFGGTVGTAIDSRAGAASFWSDFDLNAASMIHMATARDDGAWQRSTGRIHAYKLYGTDQAATSETLYFVDTGNDDTQLDISNIYIGPTWRPTFDLLKDFKSSVDKFGRRIWDCTFPALTLDEYESQAEAMAIAVGVGELDQIAAGGQDYGENRTPVVVILDPANPTQSQTLYGWIISYSATRISVEAGAIRYTVKMRFREVLP